VYENLIVYEPKERGGERERGRANSQRKKKDLKERFKGER
jgi:hypothetical protein